MSGTVATYVVQTNVAARLPDANHRHGRTAAIPCGVRVIVSAVSRQHRADRFQRRREQRILIASANTVAKSSGRNARASRSAYVVRNSRT